MANRVTHQQKRQLLEAERRAILSRYNVRSSAELRRLIEEGSIPEHPAWEEYIELVNIEDLLQREAEKNSRTI